MFCAVGLAIVGAFLGGWGCWVFFVLFFLKRKVSEKRNAKRLGAFHCLKHPRSQ